LAAISIITPVYNRQDFIHRPIESALRQTFQDWELIIVDNGSHDGTSQVIESFPDQRIKYHYYETKQGPIAARNHGFSLAQGQFIIFLDADDWWADDCLSVLYNFLQSCDPDVALAHANWAFANQQGEIGIAHDSSFHLGEGLHTLVLYNPFAIHAALIRRDVIASVGGFTPLEPSLEDWELWLKIGLKGYRFTHVPHLLAFYLWHPKSKSKDVFKRKADRLSTLDRFWQNAAIPPDIKPLRASSYATAYVDFCVSQIGRQNMKCALEEFDLALSYDLQIAEKIDTYYRLIYADQAASEGSQWERMEKLDEEQSRSRIEIILDHLVTRTLPGRSLINMDRASYSAYLAMAQALYAERRMKSARKYLVKAMHFSKSPFSSDLVYLYTKSLFPVNLLNYFHRIRHSMKTKTSL